MSLEKAQAWFFHNFWLKLFSLILAALIWFTVKSIITQDESRYAAGADRGAIQIGRAHV